MAKSLLKKAKKATKKKISEEKSGEISVPKSPSVSIRDHIEKLSGERRDCFTIWTLIKNTEIYTTDADIIKLITSKGYETLLGEIS